MKTDSADQVLDPGSLASPLRRGGRVSGAWVVAGLAMGGCVAFGLMWQNECRRAAYWETQVAPLKVEAARYRTGLREEIARNMRLAEELRVKKAAEVSVR